jgi:hypothetical protein
MRRRNAADFSVNFKGPFTALIETAVANRSIFLIVQTSATSTLGATFLRTLLLLKLLLMLVVGMLCELL